MEKLKFSLIAAVATTLFTIACSKSATDIKSSDSSIFAIFEQPIVEDEVNTKALSYDPSTNAMNLFWQEKEKIDVFSNTPGEQMIYTITPDPSDSKKCIFKVTSFGLLNGEYYSFSPTQGAVDDSSEIPLSVLGHVQNGATNTEHLAAYDYNIAVSEIESNAGNFSFTRQIGWLAPAMTFPEDVVLDHVSFELPSEEFISEATMDVKTGAITPVSHTNTLVVKFKEPLNVTAGQEVYVFQTIFPFTFTAQMNVIAHCTNGDSFEIATKVDPATRPANRLLRIRRDMVKIAGPTPEPEGAEFKKVSDVTDITAGDYLLVYKNGTDYNLFSFDKIMANAEEASKYVLGCTGIEHLAQHHTAIYQKTIGGNYETIAADEFNNDETLIVPADMNGVVISATGDCFEGATTLTTTDGKYTLGLKKIEVALAADGSALISTAFNPADVANILNTLRGHEIGITFEELIKYGAKEAGLTSLQLEKVLKSFDKMCEIAKFEFTEHNVLDLMDIDRSTKIMDVFVNHYDDFIELAELYDDHRYGFAKPVGFFAADNGFTFNVPVPGSEWFERAQASFEAAMAAAAGKSDAEGWAAAKEAFVAYWAQFDSELHISSYPNVFSNLASRSVNAIDYSSFKVLASMNWTKFGGIYTQTVNMLNDPLEDVCLYKRVN
ncbi:MAG: hypothetical protein MJZ09_07215 [Bacteroidales bacterium]|nr:hypothetical protein [Bacteroidales bacterium]